MMKRFIVLLIILLLSQQVFAQKEGGDYISDDDKSRFSDPFAQPKFVPNISLIADFSYAHRDYRDEEYQRFRIPGFIDVFSSEDEGLYSCTDSQQRGINLNYGEVALQAAVDPYFDLFAVFHLTESSLEIEELYFSTRSMPFDLQIKAGRFLSGFGRLNSQHAHFWDFADMPIIYNVLLGTTGLLENGVQISWLAPFDFYLMIGGEILQGENEYFSADGFTVEGSSTEIKGSEKPNVYTGFIKTSLDTDDFIVLLGISSVFGHTRADYEVNTDVNGYAIDACTGVYGVDLTLKYLIDSYRYVSLQGEYLYRHMNGSKYLYDGTILDMEKRQGGLYAQLIVKPFLLWRFGARYDILHKNDIYLDEIRDTEMPENTDRFSFMIEYNFSEFSRFRLQFNQDRTKYSGDDRKIVNEIIFQCNLAIGAHGAHKF
jgi:hypothetical protein